MKIFAEVFVSPCKLMKPPPKCKWKCCFSHTTKVSCFLLPALTERLFGEKKQTTSMTKPLNKLTQGKNLGSTVAGQNSFSQNFIPNILAVFLRTLSQKVWQSASPSSRQQEILADSLMLWVWDSKRFLLIHQVQFEVQLRFLCYEGFTAPFSRMQCRWNIWVSKRIMQSLQCKIRPDKIVEGAFLRER